jgi:bifunctional pyridoxal-dependent enzyme with beta-cystathionase and maltose regulon repressor activities
MSKFVRQADSQKWGDSSYDEEKFMLTIADMDIPIFESLKKKIIDRVAVVNNFTYKNPSKAYYQSIIDWHKQRHIKDSKVDLQSQDIVDSPSILNTIYLLIQGLTKEGDGILLTTPVFSYYARIATYLKRKVIESRLYN